MTVEWILSFFLIFKQMEWEFFSFCSRVDAMVFKFIVTLLQLTVGSSFNIMRLINDILHKKYFFFLFINQFLIITIIFEKFYN